MPADFRNTTVFQTVFPYAYDCVREAASLTYPSLISRAKSAIWLAMGNEKFEDISVLKALIQLRAGGLLHPDDSKVLLERLQTDWRRKAAADFLSDNHEAFAEARSLLRRFSVAA